MTDDNNNNRILFGILKSKINIYQIKKFPFTIGRSSENDISINHKSVSGKHAILQISNFEGQQNIILVDLNSSNGTYVNNKRIEKKSIQTGDKIRFGKFNIEYIFESINNLTSTNYNDYNNNNENTSTFENNKSNNILNKSENTIIYPLTTGNNNEPIKKISLINCDLYQHAKINHFDYKNNNLEECKNNTSNISNINCYNINNDEFLLFNKLKNELIPDWRELSVDALNEKVDTLIKINKQKMNLCEIITCLQNQYNEEVNNFNYILKKYDSKLSNIIDELKVMYNENSNNSQEVGKILLFKQINDLIKEKEIHIMTINKLKGDIIRLKTEIKLKDLRSCDNDSYNLDINYNTQNNKGTVNKLNDKIGELEEKIQKIEKNKLSMNNSICTNNNNVSVNDCLINTIKESMQKDQEINRLNSKLCKYKEKFSIDANTKPNNFSTFSNRNRNAQSDNILSNDAQCYLQNINNNNNNSLNTNSIFESVNNNTIYNQSQMIIDNSSKQLNPLEKSANDISNTNTKQNLFENSRNNLCTKQNLNEHRTYKSLVNYDSNYNTINICDNNTHNNSFQQASIAVNIQNMDLLQPNNPSKYEEIIRLKEKLIKKE